MKITRQWLDKHLKTNKTTAELVEALTALGLEVDAFESVVLDDVVVGHVHACDPHPDADKLKVCQVFDGEHTYTVVCGAHNVAKDKKYPFARLGAFIPSMGKALKKGKIRGIESQGMLCSGTELALDMDSGDGILELPSHFVTGENIIKALGKNNAVIDIALTPNRSDCFSVRGIARDLAAFGMGVLLENNGGRDFQTTHPPLETPPPAPEKETLFQVETKACAFFSGCLIRHIKKDAVTPQWMKDSLASVGIKSISPIVDITNYVCHDLGQPLHAFDADSFHGPLRVCNNITGTLQILDGRNITITEGMICVTDTNGKPLSLAGIMGGEHTGCTEKTENVFLEAALFCPESITKAGQKLKITSESRTRFERGVDKNGTYAALAYAQQLIQEICAPEKIEPIQVADYRQPSQEKIYLSLEKIKSYGCTLSFQEVKEYLEKLGCYVEEKEGGANVTAPSWRYDLTLDVDLIEEVLRLHGYDRIALASLPTRVSFSQRCHEKILKSSAIQCGLQEVYTLPFLEEAVAGLQKGEHLSLVEPLNAKMAFLRNTLVLSHLDIAHKNQRKSLDSGAIFESARCPNKNFSGLRYGFCQKKTWQNDAVEKVSLFDVKADVFTLLDALGISRFSVEHTPDVPAYYHPYRYAEIKQGQRVLGCFGEIHPKHCQGKGGFAAFELFLNIISANPEKASRAQKEFSIYQPVLREFSFIVDDTINAGSFLKEVEKVCGTLLQDLTLLDVYKGENVPQGKKSFSIQLSLQSLHKTLENQDLQKTHEDLVFALGKKFQAILRDQK